VWAALQFAASGNAQEGLRTLAWTSPRTCGVSRQGLKVDTLAENGPPAADVSDTNTLPKTGEIGSLNNASGKDCWLGGVAVDFVRSTDVVVLNMGPDEADAEVALNTPYGRMEGVLAIPASSQRTIHLAGMIGPGSAGTVYVAANQPVIVNGHITETTGAGKCGQFIGGHSNWRTENQDRLPRTGWLVGLRQLEGQYRTDFLLTNPNCGSEPTPVEITLFANDGTALAEYSLAVEGGTTLFNSAPLKKTAGRPNLAWGYARIDGSVQVAATVVDLRTRDATTVPMIREIESEVDLGGEWQQWLEIAASCDGHMDSSWRTDLVVLNPAKSPAQVDLIFHAPQGGSASNIEIPASNQVLFKDIVGLLGSSGKGLLEIRSDRPLAVSGRVYNTSEAGTAGHALPGRNLDSSLTAGDTVWLAGLRQMAGAYRTNINVSNLGESSATVRITLFDADGNHLADFERDVPPKRVIQDIAPFSRRGRKPNLGWGFARAALDEGGDVIISASVINCDTNDAIMVPMAR
jgi:hypothetical protein